MKHSNPITSAQFKENSFITNLESNFTEDEIQFIVELTRKHYFNPCDTIAKYWSINDVFAQTDTLITNQKALKCLAYLENLDDEHSIEYEGIEYFLENK